MTEALVVLVSVGLVWSALGALSLVGRLRRNPIAGVRVSGAMVSDSAWSAAQRAAAPLMIGTGVLGLLLAVWLVFPGVDVAVAPDPGVVLNGYVGLVLVMGVVIIVVANRAVRRVSGRSDSRSVR